MFRGAIKLHTPMDLHASIPRLVLVSHGKVSDVTTLDALMIETGAFYIFDRGYMDFERLDLFALSSAFFLTRAKRGLDFRCIASGR